MSVSVAIYELLSLKVGVRNVIKVPLFKLSDETPVFTELTYRQHLKDDQQIV